MVEHDDKHGRLEHPEPKRQGEVQQRVTVQESTATAVSQSGPEMDMPSCLGGCGRTMGHKPTADCPG
jgi:hypothetical protein